VESSDLQPGTHITRPSLVEALSVVRLARTIDERLYRLISEVQMSGKRGLVFYTAEAGVPVIIGRENIGVRLVNFDGFWRQFVDPRGAGELQYVDLRFEDQVVVKWKNTGVDDQPTDQRGAVQM
jgi:cell division septal protein FtsQ